MILLAKLHDALANGRSRTSCLRRWSDFIRARDGHRCVDCDAGDRLSAHHICRKSFFAGAEFETGNGITLCHACHKEAHQGFNRRPDLSLPVDAEGGEKLAAMERFYSILVDDAVARGLMREDFYFLSDHVLGSFKQMQGYHPHTFFPGSRLEQAYLILAEPELPMRLAIAEANGINMDEQPLLPGAIILAVRGEDGKPAVPTVIRRYVPRTPSPQFVDTGARDG